MNISCDKHLSQKFSRRAMMYYSCLYSALGGLGSNPGEDMDVCKCIVPLQHGGTPNSYRAASPLVWLLEGEERWEAPVHPRVFSL
ncbi:uncharacterized protein TNCV_4585891 [Trichonephila clavipes]|nr:uncharacterized protein TNCV_4585891 [Trichonephila clavipes]